MIVLSKNLEHLLQLQKAFAKDLTRNYGAKYIETAVSTNFSLQIRR